MCGDDPVADYARAFLSSVMPILKQRCLGATDEALELSGFTTWAPELQLPGMRRYKARPMVIGADRQCALRVLGELREAGNQDILDFDQVLGADALIGPRLRGGSVISFGAGGGAWQAPSVVLMLVEEAIKMADGFGIGAAEIDRVTTQWLTTLRRASDQVAVVLVLHEFNAPNHPICVDPGLEIVELSDDEIAAALRLGGGLRGLQIDERTVSEAFAIRTTFESRLFIDEVPKAEAEREQAAREEAERIVGLVLLALRVFKPGRVRASATFQYTVSWPGGVSPVQGSIGPMFGWHSGEPYVLTPEEAPEFCTFWRAFRSAYEREPIAAAVRRYDYGADRGRADDAIVDLVIAAETLFFSDISKDDRGEFRFRLATRVALLLGETLDERRRLAKFMRHAYDARSGIVHGGDPGAANLRSLDGDRVTAAECAEALKDVIRRAILAAITHLASGEQFPPDWESLMFGRL